MDYTQETMRKRQERERAIMYLDDYLCEASIESFISIVAGAMDKHYNNESDKRKFNYHTQQPVELTVRNWSIIGRQIATILPENVGAEDLAKYTAEVLRNEYGSHNFLPFITKLINELENDTIG